MVFDKEEQTSRSRALGDMLETALSASPRSQWSDGGRNGGRSCARLVGRSSRLARLIFRPFRVYGEVRIDAPAVRNITTSSTPPLALSSYLIPPTESLSYILGTRP